MSIKNIFWICCASILFFSCNESQDKSLVGKWQTSYLKVDFHTYNGSDSIFTVEDKFDKRDQVLAQSLYNENGTFVAWFLNDKGEKENGTSGTWHLKNDSLFTSYFYLGREIKPSYKIQFIETGFEAQSTYDWDGDGNKDDFLWMVTKKIQ